MDYQETLTKYLLALLEGLKQGGVKRAVISSGSRSTPLALLANRDSTIQTFVDIDERSAGFFALGLAKQSGQPVALICTSGTAAANYFPAVCEAEATNIPLIVLTTDRPAELQGVGAPQAMDQHDLYGNHVKKAVELALPEGTKEMLDYSQWTGFSLVSQATAAPRGPVQINIPLREPLLPDLKMNLSPVPALKTFDSTRRLDLTVLAKYFKQPGIIIVGEERTPEEARLLLKLAQKLKWPIVGDPLTNLATVNEKSPNYLHQADIIFHGKVPVPRIVLRFGRLPVTKPVMQWLKECHLTTILVEDGHQFKDQLHRSNYVLDLTVGEFMACFDNVEFTPVDDEWLYQWQRYQEIAEDILNSNKEFKSLNHSSAVRELLGHLHDQDLFVANSNSIRLVDRLTSSNNCNIRVFGNRGVNGIDGLNSTVAGIAATGLRPVTILIGDLAFFHDLTGLEMIKRYQLPVTIILLNNNGGGIFSFLSQKQLPAQDFATVFKTPQDLDFKHLASLYGFKYLRPTNVKDFVSELNQEGQRIIEIADTQDCPVDIWDWLIDTYEKRIGGLND